MSGASSPEAFAEDRAPRRGMLKERLTPKTLPAPLYTMVRAILRLIRGQAALTA
jgi:hypothetical protein